MRLKKNWDTSSTYKKLKTELVLSVQTVLTVSKQIEDTFNKIPYRAIDKKYESVEGKKSHFSKKGRFVLRFR